MARKPNTTPTEPAEEQPTSPRSKPFGFGHFTIFGRLAADPILSSTPSGTALTKATLVINDRGGEAHYLDLTVFGQGAETLATYAAKGRGLVAYGRMATHTWGDEGARRKSIDFIVQDFHFADRAPSASRTADDVNAEQAPA